MRLKASHRAKDLVKQILTFSRQESEDRTYVQVHLIVNEALRLLRASIPTTIENTACVSSKGLTCLDGTHFDGSKNTTVTAAGSSTSQFFSFSWEESSGEGLAIYGEGNSNLYTKRYDPTCPLQTCWDPSAFNTISTTGSISGVRSCSNPNSNYLGFIYQDSRKDVAVQVWNGTGLTANPATEDADTEVAGTYNPNFDCAFFNTTSAVFGFTDANQLLIDYVIFTEPFI